MENQFYKFLKSREEIKFTTPSDSDIEKMNTLAANKLPETFLDVYTKSVPKQDVEYKDFIFYGISRIIEENTQYIPGANLLPFGLFTFASTFDGDSICFDTNSPSFPVFQCSHSLLSGEDDIFWYKEGMHTLPFNYENVLKIAPKLADSFDDFVLKLLSGKVRTFSVTDMIDKL